MIGVVSIYVTIFPNGDWLSAPTHDPLADYRDQPVPFAKLGFIHSIEIAKRWKLKVGTRC